MPRGRGGAVIKQEARVGDLINNCADDVRREEPEASEDVLLPDKMEKITEAYIFEYNKRIEAYRVEMEALRKKEEENFGIFNAYLLDMYNKREDELKNFMKFFEDFDIQNRLAIDKFSKFSRSPKIAESKPVRPTPPKSNKTRKSDKHREGKVSVKALAYIVPVIVTLAFVGTFLALEIMNNGDPEYQCSETFRASFLIIIGYYFGMGATKVVSNVDDE